MKIHINTSVSIYREKKLSKKYSDLVVLIRNLNSTSHPHILTNTLMNNVLEFEPKALKFLKQIVKIQKF